MAPPTSSNYTKLKTNLRLSIQRLKLLAKKKTELAQKSRNEIGGYIFNGKIDRARIRVEAIIREDYLVEAFEIIEMYCDLLLTRFALIEQMKTLDDGIAEAIASIIWAAPRIEGCQELKIVADLLSKKYGKQFALAARENSFGRVNKKLINKMSIQAPPKVLIEKYLVEIAKSLDLAYEPDPNILNEGTLNIIDKYLLELEADDPNPPLLPSIPPVPPNTASSVFFNIDNDEPSGGSAEKLKTPIGPQFDPKELETKLPKTIEADDVANLLPQVPSTLPDLPVSSDETASAQAEADIDFDELTKRFEALKKLK